MVYEKFMSMTKGYLQDDSVKTSVFVTAGTLIASFFAYLLQIYLGRIMTVGDYGYFNAALAFTTLLAFFSGGVTVAIVKTVSGLFGQKKKGELRSLFWYLMRVFFLLGIGLYAALTFFNVTFSHMFNIPHPEYFIFFGVYMVSSYVGIAPVSFLQGMLMFKAYSAYLIVSSLFRTISAGIVAYLGYSVGVMYFSMSIAEFCVLAVVIFLITRRIGHRTGDNIKPYLLNIIKISVPVMAIYFGLIFFNSVDVLMVKRYFDAESTGLYVGAATMGKIILFGTSSISIVMLPRISVLKANAEDYRRQLRKLSLVQLGIVLAFLLVFLAFPELITLFMFGAKFTGSISLLPFYAIFISIYVLIGYVVKFFVAIDKNEISLLLIAFTAVQTAFLYFFHESLEQVLFVDIGVMTVLLAILLFFMRRELKEL